MKFSKNPDESTVENYLLTCVKAVRGLTIKLRFLRGWPDRLVLLRGGRLIFIELKRPKGGKFEPLQLRIHIKLRALGFKVFTCYDKFQVDLVMELYADKN